MADRIRSFYFIPDTFCKIYPNLFCVITIGNILTLTFKCGSFYLLKNRKL